MKKEQNEGLLLKDLFASKESLEILSNTKLPAVISYKINKIYIQVKKELEVFDKTRNDLIKEYGEENPETKGFSVKQENMDKFLAELNKILDLPVNIEIEKIKIEDLGNIEIEPRHLVTWLFE